MASAGAGRPSSCGLVSAACCRPQASDSISTEPATIAPPATSARLIVKPSLIDRRREAVRGGDAPIEAPARPHGALERCPVDLDQAKPGRVAARPFEIVQVRPVEVAPDVDAVVDRLTHAGEHLDDVALALGVVIGGQA